MRSLKSHINPLHLVVFAHWYQMPFILGALAIPDPTGKPQNALINVPGNRLIQIRVKYPFFSGDKAEGKGQKAEERKDFKQKGGYQGGFGINYSFA